MNHRLRRALELGLVDTHLWVSTAAAGLALFASAALGLPTRTMPAGIVFSATLLIYAVDDFFDGCMHAQPWRWCTLSFGLISVGAHLLWAPTAVAVAVVAGTVPALFYGMQIRGRRLRELPTIKPFFVAGSLTTAVVVVPVLWSWSVQEPFPAVSRIAVVAALLFGLVTCNVCFFDLRDRVDDARAGVRTIPVALGVVRTRWLCLALCLGVALVTLLVGSGLRAPLIAAAFVTAAYARLLPVRSSRLGYGPDR